MEGSTPFAQFLELVGAGAPAGFEAHVGVTLRILLGPMARLGGVARAAALRLDRPDADHERAGRLEVADDRVGEGETFAFVPSQHHAVMRMHFSVWAVH